MGSVLGNLTNSSLQLPGMSPEFAGSSGQLAQKLSRADVGQAQPSAASVNDSGDVSYNQPAETAPAISKPSFSRAANSGPGGTPNALSPALSTKGKLLSVLLNAAKGGGAGAGSMTFGQGFETGGQLPFIQAQRRQELEHGDLSNQLTRSQVQYAPLLQKLGIMKSQADISKTQTETGKSAAETAAIPTKTALEEAQTEAANYKDDPNAGLIDLRTKQPVSGQGFVPLTPEEAQVLGKQPGERVPLKVKSTASEIVNRGIRSVSAGGRQKLIDGQGNTIRDLGAATPVVVNNMNNNPDGGKAVDPSDPNVQAVANGKMKIADVLTNRTPVSQRREFLKAVLQANPNFNSSDYDVEKGVAKDFTSGPTGKQLTAIATAREHMQTFKQLSDALNNGDIKKLNQLGNAFGVEFGSDNKTNFDIAAHAFGGEVGKALDGAGVTAGERAQAQSEFNAAMSKGQFKGAIETVDKLLAGKQKAAKQSYEKGRKAQPNFGNEGDSQPVATHRYNPQTHQIEPIQ